MPELPEVEVTRLGIAPHLQGRVISAVKVLDGRLRWPVPSALTKILPGQKVHAIERRGKYLLIEMDMGHLLIHLGMTGTLRVLPCSEPLKTHDRVTFEFGKFSLRLHDPRKFGAVLWHPKTKGALDKHVLLQKLGVEPFSSEFAGELGAAILYQASRKRSIAVKQFLLAGQAVVGVGNIYASESLWRAKISPLRPAHLLNRRQTIALADAIRSTLQDAIDHGGTTIRDYRSSDNNHGNFQEELAVYGRNDKECRTCSTNILLVTQAARSTYFCPICQK